MANSVNTTGICLYALPAREEAVLKRVISFSSTQGRNYVLAEPQTADMLVVSDATNVDPAQMNPAGCLLIRIADAGTTQVYDVLMQRPLLVTKVMRTLDEAKSMLSAVQTVEEGAETPVTESPVASTVTPAAVPSSTVESQAEPTATSVVTPGSVGEPPAASIATPVSLEPESKPAPLSLYARILGGGAAKNAAAQQAQHKPVSEPKPESKPQAGSAPAAGSQYAVPQQPGSQSEATAVAAGGVEATSDETVTADTKPVDAVPATAPQNSENSGTPLAPASAVDRSAHAATDGTVVQPDKQHLALVVDDSAAIRKQLELELRAAGIGAEFAETGEEALEKVAARRYDLIFLDIIMPGIDGYEACRQMRLRVELKKTPIIMLSAKASPLDEVQGVIAGASTYLTKPVKSDQLQQTLKRVSMWLDNFQVNV